MNKQILFIMILSFLWGATAFCEKTNCNELDSIPKPKISEKWKTSMKNQSRIDFLPLLNNNFVFRTGEMSSDFAACATLVGLIDEVIINEQEIMGTVQYWDQFSNAFSFSGKKVFEAFLLDHTEYTLTKKSDAHILELMALKGPVIVSVPREGISIVIVACDYTETPNFPEYVFKYFNTEKPTRGNRAQMRVADSIFDAIYKERVRKEPATTGVNLIEVVLASGKPENRSRQ